MPDFLPAAEVLAKGVKHIATYVADAISERRKAFDDDEAGDYLRCAGADALAECLQTSAAADFPAAASDDPAGASSPLASAGSPRSDSELFQAAARWINDEIDDKGDGPGQWVFSRRLVAELSDRAAQFAAIEAATIRFPYINPK